jgi:probable HAF family extracellular repeat protein
MKSTSIYIAAGCLMATLAFAQPQIHYTVTDLGTFGGAYSYSYGINNAGQVAGGAATKAQTDGLSQTASFWTRGRLINLGTLDGAACPTCNSQGAQATENGEVAIISEKAQLDPDGEDFCGFGTHRQCLAAVWKDGRMTALPTLPGGRNSQTYWMNSKGETIGFSETGALDPACPKPQVRRFEAAKWSREGRIQELPPLYGDTVSFAFGINDNGQAVGVSGSCADVSLPSSGLPDGPHAVLWDKNGSPTAIGTLPGGVTTMPTSINNRGDVVGNVHFEDGSVHPFLWTKQSGMQDLGVAHGDFVTVLPCCGTIDNHGNMAGFSCGPNGCRAVVYGDHRWTDLNTLIRPGTGLYLQSVSSMNDAGQFVGAGATKTGDMHAFLATPSTTKADAGPKDATVTARSIQLDGTQSTSSDGKDLSFLWTIPYGSPSAAILGGTTATPAVQFGQNRGTYTFQLTVIDSGGTKSTDMVTVNYMGN